MGRMIRMIDCRCAFLSPAGPFCGAYAIRPYPDGQKMITVGACHWVEYAKRGAMPASHCLTWRRSYACDLYYLGAWGLARWLRLSCNRISRGITSDFIKNIPDQFVIYPNSLLKDRGCILGAIEFCLDYIAMPIFPFKDCRCNLLVCFSIQEEPHCVIG